MVFYFMGLTKKLLISICNSEEPFFEQMAIDFSKFQIGVSLHAFAESYIDLASLR